MKHKKIFLLNIVLLLVGFLVIAGIKVGLDFPGVKNTAVHKRAGEVDMIMDEYEDLLVGVYITEEPLEEGCVYMDVDEDDDKVSFDTGVDGVDGYSCFMYFNQVKNALTFSDEIDENICEYSAELESGSFLGKVATMNATVYYSEPKGLYIYPVYQNAQESIVLLSKGEYINPENIGGDIVVKEYKDSIYRFVNGKFFETTVSITFKQVSASNQIKITQMSKNDEIIKSDTYNFGEISAEYTPEKNTEYFVVSIITEDEKDNKEFKDVMVNKEDCEFKVFDLLENGMFTEKYISVDWVK